MELSKAKYNQLFDDTSLLHTVSVEDLDALIKLYPYCQNLHQFKLKKLYEKQSIYFETQLPLTAIHTANRTQLKNYIKSVPYSKEKVTELEIKEKKTAENYNQEKPHVENSSNNEHEDLTPDFELPPEAIAAAIDASIQEEISTETVDQGDKISDAPNLPPAEQKQDQDQKRSFVDWIKSIDEKNRERISEREQFKRKAEQLIDGFIASQPSIKPKKEFFSAENKAKSSISEDSEIVTETLAKIYLTQGHAEKAIKIYEQLSLKNPEKKSYFASLIKEAEKDLK